MSLGGGTKISAFTITVAIVLIVFSLLTSGVVAVFTGSSFNNRYGGIGFDWAYAESYAESGYGNITRPAYLSTQTLEITDLTPDGRVQWHSDFLGTEYFRIARKGFEWFDSWAYYNLSPLTVYEEDIIEMRKTGEVFAKFTHDIGQNRQTDVFYYPQFYINGTGDFVLIYTTLEESFDNDVITVVLGSNATHPTFDIFAIFQIVTNFETYQGIPTEVDILIKTIFWGLLLLLIVKLFVG